MIDLKECSKYKLFYDESYALEKPEYKIGAEKWYYELRGPKAVVYVQSESQFAIVVTGKRFKALLALSDRTIPLDDGYKLIFENSKLKPALDAVKLFKKRQVTDKMVASGKALAQKYGFRKSNG